MDTWEPLSGTVCDYFRMYIWFKLMLYIIGNFDLYPSDLFSDFLNSRLPPLPEETTYNSNSFQDLIQPTTEQQVI